MVVAGVCGGCFEIQKYAQPPQKGAKKDMALLIKEHESSLIQGLEFILIFFTEPFIP